jgi:DNA-binding XRE family transcriptional regulator
VRSEKTPEARLATPTSHDGETDLVLKARKGLGVTQEVFARMIGVSARSVAGWEAGRPINEASRRRIREMMRLASSLREVMRPRFVPQWLIRPNEALGGLSPVQVLEHGETDRLWRTVFLLGSGLPI